MSAGAGAADVPGADAFAAHLASLTDPGELDKLAALLPPRLRDALRDHPRRLALLEVVLDLGRAPIARFADGDETITTDALTYDDIDAARRSRATWAATTAPAERNATPPQP